MDRTLQHFEERLTKDTFTKDEVAKLLHNEAGFTAQQTRKEFDGFVSREDYDSINSQLSSVKSELAPYKEADFDKLATTEFSKLNGDTERFGDFKTLAGLTGTEDAEAVLAKATELKESGKYDFMFTKVDSGAAQEKHNIHNSPKQPTSGPITPKIGGYGLFKRKK